MVAFLKKPSESDGFTEAVDFLRDLGRARCEIERARERKRKKTMGEDLVNRMTLKLCSGSDTEVSDECVIQNGNSLVSISTDTQGQIKILPPKSAEEILAREREIKARTTLLMALSEDNLARFHNISDAKEITGKQEQPKALLTIDAGVIDWSGQDKEEKEEHALMAFNSNSSSNEVQSCYDECVASYNKLKKLYDEQRDQLSDVHVEILAYSQGYGDHRYDGVLSYENEVLQSVFFNNESDRNNNILYERFVKSGEMHVVPPHMTGNYMPSGHDVEIDESQYSYGPKTPQSSEPEARTSGVDSCESNPSIENPDCVPLPVATEPIVVSTPKVWTDAPIIEEYESDDECESTPSSDQEPPRKNVKDHNTCSQNPKVNQKYLNGLKSARNGLSYGNNRRGCYVCGSFSHLIRDCDFHEKRMAKQAAMNKNMSKSFNQKENRPNRNNVHKVTHVNQFVPSAVLTRSGKITFNSARSSGTNQVNTARQKVSTARQNCPAVLTRTASKVSTESTKVNNIKPNHVFNNVHSPSKRPFSRTTATRTNFSNPKVSTARGKAEAVSAVGGIRKTIVKASAGSYSIFVADEANFTSVEVETGEKLQLQLWLRWNVEAALKLGIDGSLYQILQSRIGSLATELRVTKQTYGMSLITLVKKVKSLEVALKRKLVSCVI
ncbi:xylulose kinase-1 [Tanacetum coccineum]